MKDLIKSVRGRYKTGMNFKNLFTLSHRIRPQTVRMRPETSKLGRTILRMATIDMMRRVEQLKQQSARMEKQRLEADKRVKRQNDLVFTNINIQIKRIKRELAALKVLEDERREESSFTKEAISSLAGRSAKRMLEVHTESYGAKAHMEISSISKKAAKCALRQMREEQDYERRRG